MRYLLLLLPAFLFAQWTFTEADFYNLSKEQHRNISISYLVGAQTSHKHGMYLAATSMVESRGGKYDFKVNHICGHMQNDVRYAKVRCQALESNPFLSSIAGNENFSYWLKQTKGDYDKAAMHYNSGWKMSSHSPEYLRRIHLVLAVFKAVSAFK